MSLAEIDDEVEIGEAAAAAGPALAAEAVGAQRRCGAERPHLQRQLPAADGDRAGIWLGSDTRPAGPRAPAKCPPRTPPGWSQDCEENRLKSNYAFAAPAPLRQGEERESRPSQLMWLRFSFALHDLGAMNADLKAILGPTNTGKTYLAVERMCGHIRGMIGFPLRLLAREVYDRVVTLKGANQVALITGEEKIVPKDARWFLCTAESMPMERDFAFVALDEGAARRRSRARPCLHRPDAPRPRPRGDDDPRLGDAEADGPGACSRRRRSPPGRASRLCPMSAPPSSPGCRRARRSSPSPPSRSTPSPRCCVGCAAARRW